MCAIFGIHGHDNAAYTTALGLWPMQERGQESSGIVAMQGSELQDRIGMGSVGENFNLDPDRFDPLPGSSAIGHNRYSTAGRSTIKEAQPFVHVTKFGKIAVAHNGNLPFAIQQKAELALEGFAFTSTSDTELVPVLIARSKAATLPEAVADAFSKIEGAYSMLILAQNMLIAIKDPRGIRPLCLGKLGDAWVLASESCAFKQIKAEYIRELEPGEMLIIEDKCEPRSEYPLKPERRSQCIFEHVYFASPDSKVYGIPVNKARYLMGRELALEHPVDADMVVPVPNSAIAATEGYASTSGIKYMMALLRNQSSKRTFTDPDELSRELKVALKLRTIDDLIAGQRIILVDDSLVRGNTSRIIVRNLRESGAVEIHMRIASPPTTNPCFYGIDTPTHAELLAANRTLEEIREYLGVDTLEYLSLDRMLKAVDDAENKKFCHACFSGDYPLPVIGGVTKTERERNA